MLIKKSLAGLVLCEAKGDEKKLLECFKLDSLDIELFGEVMEKGEDSDFDLWGE